MNKRESYLQNLPTVDTNSELQTNSLKALSTFLPTNAFCLRDERIEDYGVDASLEIRENGTATNFRAQIQLKGTSSTRFNRDGSFSLQVDTNNLNYLLNNPVSIYVLYLEKQDELRFIWAQEEFKKLADTNPQWMNQETTTLRFVETLDLERLDEIKKRIIRQNSLNRDLSEILLFAPSSNVVVEINAETFEITNNEKVLDLIVNLGINLVNEGYGKEILEKINLLQWSDREKTGVVIVTAYVQHYYGHYSSARETIALLKMKGEEVTFADQQFIEWIETSCDYRLGRLNFDEYSEQIAGIAHSDKSGQFSPFRFGNLYRLLMRTSDLQRRNQLAMELRSELLSLASNKMAKESVFGFRFHILEAELGTIIMELHNQMADIAIRKSLNVYETINDEVEDVGRIVSAHNEKTAAWQQELHNIFAETENDILKADILVEKALFVASEFATLTLHASVNEVDLGQLDENRFETCESLIAQAITVYVDRGLVERKLSAKTILAELMHLCGNVNAAHDLFTNVSESAEEMSYAVIKSRSDNPISKTFEKMIEYAKPANLDKTLAASDDEEMNAFALDSLENMKLPMERLPNVLIDAKAMREVSRERLAWCEHIELHQNLDHAQSRETKYLKDQERFGHCELHGYKSVIGDTDYKAVIAAFKSAYCESCQDRAPLKM